LSTINKHNYWSAINKQQLATGKLEFFLSTSSTYLIAVLAVVLPLWSHIKHKLNIRSQWQCKNARTSNCTTCRYLLTGHGASHSTVIPKTRQAKRKPVILCADMQDTNPSAINLCLITCFTFLPILN